MTGLDRDATLVVTRPAADAAGLVAALRARGRTVLALPVLGIEPVDDAGALASVMARVDAYRLVVFVSPNAIRHALAHRRSPWPGTTAIGVMGPGSVEALARLGIASPTCTVVSPAGGGDGERFDSESLFDALRIALDFDARLDARVLIVRGNGGRGWLADRLREAGSIVDEVEAYRRVRPVADEATAGMLGRLHAADAKPVFVVTSSEGLDHLTAIVEAALARSAGASNQRARTWLLACPILAPHRRIVEKAQHLGFTGVVQCAPGDRGVLAAIE